MSMQILTTKLYIPPTRTEAVIRYELVDRINHGLYSRLTLVSAPAGFGKTTLVSQWIDSCKFDVAWLSLDEQDNDPHRFLTHFLAALQTIMPEVGEDLLRTLQSLQPPPIDSLLTSLVNVIATLPDTFFLVLDDYHSVDEPEIDNALSFLLDHLPPQMHLVMTTREDPPLPLARLRARGHLTEIRASDLRFSIEETSEFLSESMRLDLSTDDIVALEARTEGWIAGLQLAALSLRGRTDIHSFVEKFAGDHRYIVDYLIEEVLQHQPTHIQDFLLQTSILDRLSPALCAAVTNQDEDADLLEQLERANLFVIHLDDERRWYRYHHLFADVLRAHLLKELPKQIPELHLRASQWYEQNHLQPDAIRHALLANDYDRAADLVEMTWPALMNGYRPATWVSWVKALPQALVKNRPMLNVGCAWSLIHAGDLEGAEGHILDAERWLEIVQAGDNESEMIVVNTELVQNLPRTMCNIRIYVSQSKGDVVTAIENGHYALDFIPEDNHFYRGVANLVLALAYLTSGNLHQASELLADSIQNFETANNSFFQTLAIVATGDIDKVRGRLNEAESKYKSALKLPISDNGFTVQEVAELYVSLSELCYERNDLQAALEYLRQGQNRLVKQALMPGRDARWGAMMARTKIAEGDLSSALELLDEAQRAYKPDIYPRIRPFKAEKVRIWIQQGMLTEPTIWARQQNLSIDDDLSYLREFEHITYARLLISQGQPEDALVLLNRLLEAADNAGRMQSVIEVLVLQTIAHHNQNKTKTALKFLERAISLAEPEGYIRIFVHEGLPIKNLLTELYQQKFMPDYIAKLLNAFDPIDNDSQIPSNQALIEPLSERELEILQLIADGLSNREISDQLYLALSTVKGHNRNIFGKLGVNRRTEAVALARELGLIED